MGEAEDNLSLYALQMQRYLCQPRGDPFARQFGSDHDHGYDDRSPTAPKERHINQHADAQEEQRHEEVVSHEVNTLHDRTEVRHEFIQRHTADEGTEDTFQSRPVGHIRGDDHHRHDNQKAACGILPTLEETLCQPREDERDEDERQVYLTYHRPKAGFVRKHKITLEKREHE